ncbi:MAG TPA: SCO family protein [Nitrospirota bacterium]
MAKPISMLLVILLSLTAFAAGVARADGPKYKRTVESYMVPDVVLVDQDGGRVTLRKLLDSDKPVIVEFIFGTCTTICPILSAGYANLQRNLGANTRKVLLVSVTIDPENDTPRVMSEYLKRYKAKPGWDFLTGTRADIDEVMRAFNAYVPNKMSHRPLTFIRATEDGRWVRINGLMSTSEFMEECRKAGIR